MRVRCAKQCDVIVPGQGVKALFPGQSYELTDEVASALINSGMAESAEPSPPASASDKAVHGPMDPPKRSPRVKADE